MPMGTAHIYSKHTTSSDTIRVQDQAPHDAGRENYDVITVCVHENYAALVNKETR
jgi:hypothetical protein